MHARKISGWLIGLTAIFAAGWTLTAQQPKKVDDAALKDASKTGQEWITYNLGWSEQRYSPLNQINATNVSRLGLAWYYDIPSIPGGNDGGRQEGTPLIYNGVMYSITPWSIVYAVDAKTGKEVWHSDPEVNRAVTQGRICCGVVNRGIAMYGDKIIAPVVDGRLRALDMTTGKIAWETRVTPINQPYSITMAPRVIKGGKVIVGASGGEFAVRGFFDAYDAETGKLAWRFYTVPGDPSKPFEQPEFADWAKTWSGEWWKLGGGGPVWGGIAYDPDDDIVYVGVGQPGPWTSVARGKGDDLCTDCIVAVRGTTGKLVWYYQTTPGDDWDYDSIADIMLADLTINGKLRHVVMHAPKNGFFYVLDRGTGELLSADPYVPVNWSSGVNLKTGRPTVNPEAKYGTESVNVMPGPGGGHVWPPWSFNPTTGLVYVPSTAGSGYGYQANPDFVPIPTDIGPEGTGRGVMGNMATGRGNGGGGGAGGGRGAAGGAGAGRGGAAGGAAAPVAPGIDPGVAARGPGAAGGRGAAAGPPVPSRLLVYAIDGTATLPAPPPPPAPPAGAAGAPGGAPGGGGRGGAGGGGRGAGGGGRGGAGGAARGPAPTPIPRIGPALTGTPLVAWDPVAQKERWHADDGGAGYNQGGTLSTAGNLVFAGVRSNLRVYRADTGEKLADIDTHLTQVGPPMTFMLDGKQYVAIAGGPPAAGGGRGRGN